MQNKSRRSNRRAPFVLRVLLVISLTATVVCACGVGWELYTRRQGRSYYAALSVVAERRSGAARGLKPTSGSSGSTGQDAQELWAPYLDFDAARQVVPDIAAWIRCEGTPIDYPVVLGADNDYYLNHLPDKKSNKMGSIFLDYRNNPDFSDRNSVIYGHHVKSGDMFGSLEQYKQQAFFDEHPVVDLYTPEQDYVVEIFAGCVVSGSIKSLPLSFDDDDEAFEQYIEKLRRDSVIFSNVEVGVDDRIVTLCTCTYNFANARFLLVGKLTPVGG